MKKIFSAFLLMTMMVFSVGSFVSCSDLENELAQVEGTANNNAAAIEDLNSELAALKTALSAAQADADAAMAAAKAAKEAGDAAKAEAAAAKAAAEQAKAEAIAAAMAEIEAIQTAIAQNVEAITNLSGSVNANAVEIEALQEEIKALQTAAAEHVYAITNLNGAVEAHDMAIADLQTELAVLEATLENFKKNLDELGLEDDALWTSISENLEAITNLQGRVDAQQMAIEDLMPAFEDVVAQVKTLNESLVVVYDILGVLANQIQSVVFVPEYDTDVVYAQRYALGSVVADAPKTNYIATATYEVRPAKLAASLTSENLSFACVDVKATKAAAPEYFAAEVISADANTGRIVVAAIINDKDSKKDDNDYDVLANGTLAMSLNIASIDVTELLIAESEPVNVDMVSSEYVNVVANKDAAIQVGFASDETVVSTYSKEFEMPYNTEISESVVKLFQAPVKVLVEGRLLSVEEANAILGTNLAVSYAVETTYSAPKDKVSPVKVNGKDINATATLVNSADYPGDKAVDQYAVAELEVAVKNAKATVATLTGEATYTITNKISDFSFATVKESWKYTDGKTKVVEGRELAVNGYDKFVKGNTYEFTATYGEKNDKTVSTTVTALSSKAVEFTTVELPFTPGKETTYTFEGEVEDGTTTYEVAFKVILGAMPEDKPIDLGTFTIFGDVVNEQTVNVSPITKAIEDIKKYDSSITIEDAYEYFVEEDTAVSGVKGDGVTLNGEEDADAAKLTLATAPNEKNDKLIDETSYVTVAPVVNYENTVVVTKTYEFCGVQYTFTATVKTEKPAIKFVTNDVFVKNGVANVDGTVKLPVTKSKNAEVTGTSTAYTLDAIDLRNYVHVVMPEDIKENGYEIRYTLLTPMTKLAEDGKTPVALYPTSVVADTDYKAYTEVDADRKKVGLNTLNWNVDLNELEFEIALVSSSRETDRNDDDVVDANDDIVFEAVKVKLQIPSLVKFAAAETVSAKYVNGVATTANIVNALTIVDKFGNNVYNPYATTLNDLFKGYNATLYNGKVQKVDFTGVDEDFFNVYDMAVEAADLEDVKVYLNNTEISQSQVKFTYDDETGMILFSEENADITGDVKFEVPVTLTYMYDNYGKLAQEVTAVVVFSQNAEAGEGTEVSFPNPYGAQWAFEMCVQGEPKMDANGNMLDAEGNVVNREDYASIDDYFAAVAFDYPKSNAVLDLTGETLVAGVEMQGTYIPVLPYTVAYKVVPTDSTSGAIQLIELDRTGVSTGVVLGEIPYKDFDGQKCTFDLTVANLVDFETESGVVTATLVPEDEVITIGYPTGDDDLYGPAL